MDNCVCSAQQLAIISNAIAVALSENLTASQLNVLGNLVVQVGSTLLSIAATVELCNEAQKPADNSAQKGKDKGAS